MNVMPVAAFLKDFSDYLPEPLPLTPEEQSAMLAEAVEAARMEGMQQGREEALAEAEAQRAAREIEFESELEVKIAAAREAWAAEQGAVLAAAIEKNLGDLRDSMLAATAEALKPFLIESVRRRAVTELGRTIGDLLLREPEAGIAVSGPQDLLKSLELQLSEHAGALTFVVSDTPEVEVKAGHALLSTHISAWVEKINEACP